MRSDIDKNCGHANEKTTRDVSEFHNKLNEVTCVVLNNVHLFGLGVIRAATFVSIVDFRHIIMLFSLTFGFYDFFGGPSGVGYVIPSSARGLA